MNAMDRLYHVLDDTNAGQPEIDKAAQLVLKHAKAASSVIPISELSFEAWLDAGHDLYDAWMAIQHRRSLEEIRFYREAGDAVV